MRSLDDYLESGWLQSGWHHVKVTAYEMTSNPKQSPPTPGVEFQFAGVESGERAKETFWLTDKSLWRLASFARDCGMTKEERKSYDPHNQNEHRKLNGMECWIELEKDGKYHRVVGFRSLKDGQPPPPRIDRSSEVPTAAEANTSRGDDIPF